MAKKFGYETKGASSWNIGKFFASRFVCPDAGILNSISVYLFNDSGSTQKIQLGIYKDVSGTIGKRLISTISVSIPAAFDDWRTIILPAFLELGSVYWLTVQLENSAAIVYIYYDAGDQEQQAYKEDWDFGTWPDNPEGLTYSANKISIYATYTPVPYSPYTWGIISKNQIDPERVEAAIARIIDEHNDDEQAHIGEGRSLDQHKLSTVIDHVVASIIADKIGAGAIDLTKFSLDKIVMMTCFESLDGWKDRGASGAGGQLPDMLGAKIWTDQVADAASGLQTEGWGGPMIVDWTKNPFAQTTFQISITTNMLAYIQIGDWHSAGFKIEDGVLYALHVGPGGSTATEITGITLTEFNVYRVVVNSTDEEIYFYVNGVLKATHNTDFPTQNDQWFFKYYLKTKTATFKYLYVRDLLWMRDR